MEKYGFVYIWRDRKKRRYYVGSHWGTETDGYVCSSSWMMVAYGRRPQDFKRRILKVVADRKSLREEEYRWLAMIKRDELKHRYYNISIKAIETFPEKRKTRQDKLKNDTGYAFSAEHRAALSEAHKGKTQSEETKTKRAESLRRAHAEGRHAGMRGKKHSDVMTKEARIERGKKISASLTGKPMSEETKQKVREAGFGSHWKGKTRSPETKAKMAISRAAWWSRKKAY